jgi:hypothetical protein
MDQIIQLFESRGLIKPIIKIILRYADIRHPVAQHFKDSVYYHIYENYEIPPSYLLKPIVYRELRMSAFIDINNKITEVPIYI